MSNFSFRPGSEIKLNEERFHIEVIKADGQCVLQNVASGQIQLSTEPELMTAFINGTLSFLEEPFQRSALETRVWQRPLDDVPEKARPQIARRHHYVSKLFHCENKCFTKEKIAPFIEAMAEEIGDSNPPSASTLYRWYCRYVNGKGIRALVPRYDLRGSRDRKCDQEVLDLLSESFEEAWRLSARVSMDDVRARLEGKLKRANEFRTETNQARLPSLRTLYRIWRDTNAYDQLVLTEGESSARRKFRISRVGPQATHILERVELDHSPLDLFLIDQRTWLPCGRPTLTLAIDVYSRMPLGYYLSFGGTSTTAVIGALRHAILPKIPCTETLPGLKVNHSWSCYGLMETVATDNGAELHSAAVDDLALALKISLFYCPKRTPWFKGKIERFLKTLNYSFVHHLPGASLAHFHERGDYNPEKNTVLTLSDFIHLLEKWLLDIYAQQIHRGIRTTPWSKWHEALPGHRPNLPASVNELERYFGQTATRSLRHDGIWLKNIRYADDALLPILQAYGEGAKVKIVFNPENLESIDVWAPDAETPVTTYAVDKAYARNLTLLQHEAFCSALRESNKSAQDPKALLEARLDVAKALEQLLYSRKQTHRRKGARLQGQSSTSPDREFHAIPPSSQPTTSPTSQQAAQGGPGNMAHGAFAPRTYTLAPKTSSTQGGEE